MSNTAIQYRDVCKVFGNVPAVCGINLEVRKGDFLALLGPSGCGKTTALRLLAGFECPDRGEITIGDVTVSSPHHQVPAEKRRVGMVFQEYALFPHMNVESNVGYGLPRNSRRSERINEVLDLVGMTAMNVRMPHELSGGQQQRVALARALAPEPEVILLDEPFSNLDSALRIRVRSEVRHILRRAGVTAVFVTHDQEEALSLADNIAVMMNGKILQTDTPAALYRRPASRQIATFLGEANLLMGQADGTAIECELGQLKSDMPNAGPVEIMFRPEDLRIELDDRGPGEIIDSEYFGHDQLIEIRMQTGTTLQCRQIGKIGHFKHGQHVRVEVDCPVVVYPQN